MRPHLPCINEKFSEWYQAVIDQAELADQAPVRGCMVIRPYGYAVWERIQQILDKKIKNTGHQNAAFPLLIPKSFLEREAKHVEGFSPELAVVTHAGGKELEEPLVVRPTSETIIHYMFARWIRSWRDLPLKINQWASVVRWEMRPRAFLRTTEFWWQEGHTAHETLEEALAEAELMLQEYKDLAEQYLAIPVVTGVKSLSEQFAGADKTFTIEGLMRDGKALQMGTSHMISRNFAKAFGMSFQARNGELEYPYLTSWGVTTRLIGGLIMTHGDEKGLVLPPRIAPIQVVIVPIFHKSGANDQVIAYAKAVQAALATAGMRVIIDENDQDTPGAKFYQWELKGVPLRIEIGQRETESKTLTLKSRIQQEKQSIAFENVVGKCTNLLESIQSQLLENARGRRNAMWYKVARFAEFSADLEAKGGFYQTGWCGNAVCEQGTKEAKATIRCLLQDNSGKHCFYCGEKSQTDILIARAY